MNWLRTIIRRQRLPLLAVIALGSALNLAIMLNLHGFSNPALQSFAIAVSLVTLPLTLALMVGKLLLR